MKGLFLQIHAYEYMQGTQELIIDMIFLLDFFLLVTQNQTEHNCIRNIYLYFKSTLISGLTIDPGPLAVDTVGIIHNLFRVDHMPKCHRFQS